MKGKIQTFILKDENLVYKNLGGEKKIFVYTPPCYSFENAKDYPVIYCFDGQNIFESREDFTCEAAVSISLEKICEREKVNAIIVGIYNGEGEDTRNRELTMSKDFGQIADEVAEDSYREGTLERTGKFLTQTLMPFMAERFNVTDRPEKTILSGASSGGLASLYLGLCYPERFGRLSVLSPATALFYKKDWERFLSSRNLSKNEQKIFIYCGCDTEDELENFLYNGGGDSTILSAKDIKGILESFSFDKNNLKEVFTEGAFHNEAAWKTALENNLDFLLD